MKVLLTGCRGQVGRALSGLRPAAAEIIALDRDALDISDRTAVEARVRAEQPELIINCAAYTAVDKAESEPELARSVNVNGPANLAEAALAIQARMIHLSTDFVFDGTATTPYRPDADTHPLSVYGTTKRNGEREVLQRLPDAAVILRTSWVYAAEGQNFVLTMLRLMQELPELRIIADQVGSPTSANSIAEVVWELAARPELSGILHWTDSGVASWYDFAVAIAEEAMAAGLLEAMPTVLPIGTSDYPTPARRPAFSVLDKSAIIDAIGIVPRHWRANLRRVIGELARG